MQRRHKLQGKTIDYSQLDAYILTALSLTVILCGLTATNLRWSDIATGEGMILLQKAVL